MKSYEAIAKAIAGETVKHAKRLGLSTSLVNKWQEPCVDFTDSGAYNPLDRLETIIAAALELKASREPLSPLHYLGQRFNQIIIPLPAVTVTNTEISKSLLKTIKEFGDLAQVAAKSLEDGIITTKEAEHIHKEGWDLIRQTMVFLEKIKKVER